MARARPDPVSPRPCHRRLAPVWSIGVAELTNAASAAISSPFCRRAIRAKVARMTSSPTSQNRLARETSPYLLQHKDNPVHWWAWGPEALAEAKRSQPADPAVGRLRRLPLVPRHGARELRGRGGRGGDERAVRQHQGRPRGAARHRRHLHARPAQPGRAGRLAAHHVPRQRGEPVLGRHLLPAGAALRPARLPAGAARGLPRLRRGARQGHPQRRHAGRRAQRARGGQGDVP